MTITRLRLAMLDYPGTQRQLATECGFPATRLSEYALGKKAIPPRHVMILSAVLHVNPTDLIGEVDEDEMVVD